MLYEMVYDDDDYLPRVHRLDCDPFCTYCGDLVNAGRLDLGYTTCHKCGERQARKVKHCVVPMHKSNYVVVTDRTLLAQLTRPGRTLEG